MVGAIEDEDFAVMPTGPFLRAWLTEYVKFLELPHGERLVNRYMGRFNSFVEAPELNQPLRDGSVGGGSGGPRQSPAKP